MQERLKPRLHYDDMSEIDTPRRLDDRSGILYTYSSSPGWIDRDTQTSRAASSQPGHICRTRALTLLLLLVAATIAVDSPIYTELACQMMGPLYMRGVMQRHELVLVDWALPIVNGEETGWHVKLILNRARARLLKLDISTCGKFTARSAVGTSRTRRAA